MRKVKPKEEQNKKRRLETNGTMRIKGEGLKADGMKKIGSKAYKSKIPRLKMKPYFVPDNIPKEIVAIKEIEVDNLKEEHSKKKKIVDIREIEADNLKHEYQKLKEKMDTELVSQEQYTIIEKQVDDLPTIGSNTLEFKDVSTSTEEMMYPFQETLYCSEPRYSEMFLCSGHYYIYPALMYFLPVYRYVNTY